MTVVVQFPHVRPTRHGHPPVGESRSELSSTGGLTTIDVVCRALLDARPSPGMGRAHEEMWHGVIASVAAGLLDHAGPDAAARVLAACGYEHPAARAARYDAEDRAAIVDEIANHSMSWIHDGPGGVA